MFTNDSQSQVKNKLIILYVLQQFKTPLTNTEVTEFMMENDLLNFFELQQYLTEMAESSLIEYSESDGHHYYLMTESGRTTLELFEDRLNPSLKKSIDHIINDKKGELTSKVITRAEITKLGENDYQVKLLLLENERTLMSIDLNVISEEEAKNARYRWENHTMKTYQDVLEILTQKVTEEQDA